MRSPPTRCSYRNRRFVPGDFPSLQSLRPYGHGTDEPRHTEVEFGDELLQRMRQPLKVRKFSMRTSGTLLPAKRSTPRVLCISSASGKRRGARCHVLESSSGSATAAQRIRPCGVQPRTPTSEGLKIGFICRSIVGKHFANNFEVVSSDHAVLVCISQKFESAKQEVCCKFIHFPPVRSRNAHISFMS